MFMPNYDNENNLSEDKLSTEYRDFLKPEETINKRGLRFKDFATKIALCAVGDALIDAGLIEERNEKINRSDIAIIVSSNFGILDTVGKTVKTIHETHVDNTIALDLPNLSSNIIASTIAIWYSLTGPNITICNGSTSGAEAIQMAKIILAGNRASKAIVVGVEPYNEFVETLHFSEEKIGTGAAALILDKEALQNKGCYIEEISHYSSDQLIPKQLTSRVDSIFSSLRKVHNTAIPCLREQYGYLGGVEGVLYSILAKSELEKEKINEATIISGESDNSCLVIKIKIKKE